MSACKFHPFQKWTEGTDYFADAITTMTEEEKAHMYQKFAKTTLGQSANQQKNKMDEKRAVYYGVADAIKKLDNLKIKAANAVNIMNSLEEQQSTLVSAFNKLKVDSETKNTNLNQQLSDLNNKYNEALSRRNNSITAAKQKYENSLNTINTDPSVPPTVIQTQKNDLLNIYNATTKSANDEFETFKTSYEKNTQMIKNEILNNNNELKALKSKLDTTTANLEQQKKIASDLKVQVQNQTQVVAEETKKRDALSQPPPEQSGGGRGGRVGRVGRGGRAQWGGSSEADGVSILQQQMFDMQEKYNANLRSIDTLKMKYDAINDISKKMSQQINIQYNDFKKIENETIDIQNQIDGLILMNKKLSKDMDTLQLQINKQAQESRIDTFIPREPWKPKDQYGGTEEYGLALHDNMPPMFENKERYVICPHSIGNNSLTSYTLKNINNSPMFNMFSSESRFATGYSGLRTVGSLLSQRK